MSQTVIITTNENRARNIAIGFAVIVALTWWQITGSLPFLASSMMPEPPDGRVSSMQSFVMELFTDGLYLVGTFSVAIVSGIWSLGVSLLQMLINKSQSEKKSTSVEKLLDNRTEKIFEAIEMHLNELDKRIKQIEEVSAIPVVPVAPVASKRRASGVRS